MPKRVKIGMIGTGHGHARGKMQVLRGSDDFEVVGLAEPDEGQRAKNAGTGPFKDVPLMTVEQLLNHRGLQAVAIEGRVHELLPAARACVDAHKHIHLDKPPGDSLKTFRGLLDDVDHKHLVLQMGYMFRYNPGFNLLRNMLTDGLLGDAYQATGVMSKVISPARRQPLTRFAGGLMFELGCHLIDMLVLMMGVPKKVTPFLRHDAAIDDGLADNTLAVFQFDRAYATIESAAMEVEGFARRQFVVCGSHGVYDLRPLEPPAVRVALDAPRGEYRKGYQTVQVPDYNRYVADLVDFAKCVRGEKAVDYTTRHDLAVQQAVLQACGMPTGT